MKAVNVGNSGSGKTWLATNLAATAGVPLVHLDELFWQPGGFDRKRQPAETEGLLESARSGASWVVEGVYGDLAVEFLSDAEALVWLDLPWDVCRGRLLRRGSESKAHMARTQSDLGLAQLLAWASTYRRRVDTSSLSGHRALFEAFDGAKVRLSGEGDAGALLAAAQQHGMVEAIQEWTRFRTKD